MDTVKQTIKSISIFIPALTDMLIGYSQHMSHTLCKKKTHLTSKVLKKETALTDMTWLHAIKIRIINILDHMMHLELFILKHICMVKHY